jgi:uncharacterized membrane protein
MSERPKMKLERSKSDEALEFLGWTSIFAIWVLIFANYDDLPDSIPVHYNVLGKADRFGEKENIFALPSIATVLFIGLTILNKFLHVFNFPVNITADNALGLYTRATRLIRYLKLIIVFIFGLMVFKTILAAEEVETHGFGGLFLPLSLGLIFIPVIYYLIKLLKVRL